ncbi:MAG: transcriptional repressor [Nitrospiraceae bacterium]|nr:transcriptional repressor [Nitrospiraceae bacterium]
MSVEKAALAEKLAAFERTCEQQGLRLTSQRLEVFRVLVQATDHPTVETVHRRVLKKLPRTSLDTVYRTLSSFEENRLVTRVGGIPGSARFEANMDPHHHFVCAQCGLILDLHSQALDGIQLKRELPKGYEIERAQVELRGICAKCRDSQA